MRFFTAWKAFFAVLFNREKAEQVIPILTGKSLPALGHEQVASKPESATAKPIEKTAAKTSQKITPRQSEAITLLSAMQREARFLDFIKEKLDGYDDAQVGAAARAVHDECAVLLERFFAIEPLRKEAEMSVITVQNPDASLIQLVGQLGGEPPHKGCLTHHGWVATQCKLPQWSGNPEAALVLAPAEIELTS